MQPLIHFFFGPDKPQAPDYWPEVIRGAFQILVVLMGAALLFWNTRRRQLRDFDFQREKDAATLNFQREKDAQAYEYERERDLRALVFEQQMKADGLLREHYAEWKRAGKAMLDCAEGNQLDKIDLSEREREFSHVTEIILLIETDSGLRSDLTTASYIARDAAHHPLDRQGFDHSLDESPYEAQLWTEHCKQEGPDTPANFARTQLASVIDKRVAAFDANLNKLKEGDFKGMRLG